MTEIFADDIHAELMDRISDAYMDGAAIPCITATDPDLWTSDRPTDQHLAAAACKPCPLAAACRNYAHMFKEPAGVWGGTTPTDRGKRQTPRLKKVQVTP